MSEELQKKILTIKRLPPEEQEKAAREMLTEEEIAMIMEQQGQTTCFFCQIAGGQVPVKVVYEDDFVIAFLDKKPAAPGHTLVIPKEHYAVLAQVPSDRAALLINVVKALSSAVFDAAGAKGVTILQANGAAAGQTVPHVFFHIIPRFENDKVKTEWKTMTLADEQANELQKRIVEKAKSAVTKKQVYDVSGKVIEEKKEKKEEKPKKEKPIKIKSRLP
ncbi:MAG: HIT family protein [Candidatus Nanoarchaeia archaeon]